MKLEYYDDEVMIRRVLNAGFYTHPNNPSDTKTYENYLNVIRENDAPYQEFNNAQELEEAYNYHINHLQLFYGSYIYLRHTVEDMIGSYLIEHAKIPTLIQFIGTKGMMNIAGKYSFHERVYGRRALYRILRNEVKMDTIKQALIYVVQTISEEVMVRVTMFYIQNHFEQNNKELKLPISFDSFKVQKAVVEESENFTTIDELSEYVYQNIGEYTVKITKGVT